MRIDPLDQGLWFGGGGNGKEEDFCVLEEWLGMKLEMTLKGGEWAPASVFGATPWWEE